MSDEETRAALVRIEAEQKRQAGVLHEIAAMATEFYQEVFPGSVQRPSILARLDALEQRPSCTCGGNSGKSAAVK